MITRLVINNYRSLDVDFTLDPVTVIVGRSGTGKTNVIDALRFLKKALQHPSAMVEPHANIYSAILPDTLPVQFRIEFKLSQQYVAYVYEFSFAARLEGTNSPHPNAVVREELRAGDSVLFSRQRAKWSVEPKVLQKPNCAFNQLVLPSIVGMQEISIAYLLLTDGVGCYDFPGRVCAEESKDGDRPEAGLPDNAQNYASVLSHIRSNLNRLNDWQEIVGAMRRLNDKIVSVDMDAQQGKRLIVGHSMADRVFTLGIARESEGFRRFLAHLLALYQTPPKQTLVFEEPEKGIHPGALETLAEEIKAAPADGRGQVILTTHSPALLDHFDPDCIRVAEMKDHVTQIGKLAPEQLEALKEDLLRPGELFTVDPARLAEELSLPAKVAEA